MTLCFRSVRDKLQEMTDLSEELRQAVSKAEKKERNAEKREQEARATEADYREKLDSLRSKESDARRATKLVDADAKGKAMRLESENARLVAERDRFEADYKRLEQAHNAAKNKLNAAMATNEALKAQNEQLAQNRDYYREVLNALLTFLLLLVLQNFPFSVQHMEKYERERDQLRETHLKAKDEECDKLRYLWANYLMVHASFELFHANRSELASVRKELNAVQMRPSTNQLKVPLTIPTSISGFSSAASDASGIDNVDDDRRRRLAELRQRRRTLMATHSYSVNDDIIAILDRDIARMDKDLATRSASK